MERLNFFKNIIDSWTNLEPTKKVSYGSAIIIIGLVSIIIHYEQKDTMKDNEHKVYIDKLTDRYNVLLNASQEETRKCNENFNNYLKSNEKEVREILFKYEEYSKKIKNEDSR